MAVIYDDLEIDASDMLEKPEAFTARVLERAEELKDLMKRNDSIETHINSLKHVPSDKLPDIRQTLDGIYKTADSVPLEEVKSIISTVQKFVKDLETLLWQRAQNAIVSEQGHMDKRTAHEQYIRLREAHNQYVDSMEILGLFKGLEKLPAMPGNYGSSVSLPHYVFTFDGEDEGYRSHLAVARRLGIEVKNLMDLLEYIEDNPKCGVKVNRVTS